MQTLYPIIRRKRRPLIVADAPPVVVGNVEPGQPVSARQEAAAVAAVEPGKASDEKISSKRNTR